MFLVGVPLTESFWRLYTKDLKIDTELSLLGINSKEVIRECEKI